MLKIIIFLTIIFNSSNLCSYDLTLFTEDNSPLPSNKINDIKIDSKNHLWLATDSGLVKYNGTDWIIYNKDNSDLPSNYIDALAIDKNDNIWMTSTLPEESLIFYFNGNNWKIYNKNDFGENLSRSSELVIDSNNDPWFVGNSKIFGYINSKWKKVIDTTALYKIFYDPKRVAIDSRNNLFTSTLNNYLYEINNSKDTLNRIFIPDSIATQINISNIAIDRNDALWIQLLGPYALVKYDMANNIWKSFDSTNSPYKERLFATEIEVDKNNNLWLTANNFKDGVIGANIFLNYDQNLNKWHTIYHDSLQATNPQRYAALREIAIDSNENIWVSASNYGLIKLSNITNIEENIDVSDDYTLYPNPVTDELIIESNESSFISHYKIMDILGAVVKEGFQINANKINIDLQFLKTGPYFIEVTSSDGNIFKDKFIKQ